MAKKIKWAIMGCGGIAAKLAQDLPLTKSGQLVAVGSRSQKKAEQFAKTYKALRAYGNYEALAADEEIDVVYVATPHPYHLENALLAIKNGKHILCEKPITMNARQTKKLINAAAKKDVFLMEGMWTRFFPALVQVRKWIAEKRIGDVLNVQANFGIHFHVGPEHRIFNPELGGGGLLDLGIYPVSLASMIYGRQPKKIVSSVHFAKTGVDDQAAMIFEYEDGATASLCCAGRVDLTNQAIIHGSKGKITLHDRFLHCDHLTLEIEGRKPIDKNYPYKGNGMHYEIEHVHQCLRLGKRQSQIMPLEESYAIMQTMDTIRRQWKLKYQNES